MSVVEGGLVLSSDNLLDVYDEIYCVLAINLKYVCIGGNTKYFCVPSPKWHLPIK